MMIEQKYIWRGMLVLCCVVGLFLGVFGVKRVMAEEGAELPLREVFQQMGYAVEWHGDTIDIAKDKGKIVLEIAKKQAVLQQGTEQKRASIVLEEKDGVMYTSLDSVADMLQKVMIQDKENPFALTASKTEPNFSLLVTEPKIILPQEALMYTEGDCSEIAAYIRKNLDPYFTEDGFEIRYKENVSGFDNLTIYQKMGEFVTEHGYDITISNGAVMQIAVFGTPKGQYRIAIPRDTLTEEDILTMAKISTQSSLLPYETIEGYKILKKYDTSPYYMVLFDIRTSNKGKLGYHRRASYTYRL